MRHEWVEESAQETDEKDRANDDKVVKDEKGGGGNGDGDGDGEAFVDAQVKRYFQRTSPMIFGTEKTVPPITAGSRNNSEGSGGGLPGPGVVE